TCSLSITTRAPQKSRSQVVKPGSLLCGRFVLPVMKELAAWALNIANQRGATYADVRVIDDRSRALATKNGRIGNASDSRSQGFNIRVLIDGAWGFASSAELDRSSVEATAAR